MVLSDFNKPLIMDKIHLDNPQGNEVIIKILAAGMCGTDLGISRGIELKPGFQFNFNTARPFIFPCLRSCNARFASSRRYSFDSIFILF